MLEARLLRRATTDLGMTIVLGSAAAASKTTGLNIDESTVETAGGDGLGTATMGSDGAYTAILAVCMTSSCSTYRTWAVD